MSGQWLIGDPCIPEDMVFIPNGGFELWNGSLRDKCAMEFE